MTLTPGKNVVLPLRSKGPTLKNGNAWKITAVVFAALLSFGAYMYGSIETRVSRNSHLVSGIERKHLEDMASIKERLVATESYQNEVLRRLERIETKLEK